MPRKEVNWKDIRTLSPVKHSAPFLYTRYCKQCFNLVPSPKASNALVLMLSIWYYFVSFITLHFYINTYQLWAAPKKSVIGFCLFTFWGQLVESLAFLSRLISQFGMIKMGMFRSINEQFITWHVWYVDCRVVNPADVMEERLDR